MRVNHGDVPEGAVFAGVDTHADAHWLCVLDAVGRPLLSEAFPATPEGYDALAAAVAGAGECVWQEFCRHIGMTESTLWHRLMLTVLPDAGW